MERERINNDHLFDLSGPSHLTAVDWKNPDHCRSIAACLVQGTYILEHDHSSSRQRISRALATPWWSTFDFQLFKVLQDDGEEIYGAIYELSSSHIDRYAPKHVIAFRGTILNREHIKDVRLDLNCIFNCLHQSSRVQLGLEAVHDVATHAAGTGSNVWIVGHSLGAAIGLLVGKKMKKRGFVIETYLFNSPFISLPIELIKSKRLKRGIHFAHSVAKSTLAHVSIKGLKKKHGDNRDIEEFWATMSNWRPRLFVNPSDVICSEYIGYFEARQKTRKGLTGRIGHKIEMVATQTSLKNLVSKKLGRDSGDPFYLLPSANLTVNISDQFSGDHLRAHSINQWWNPNYHFQSTLHQFDC